MTSRPLLGLAWGGLACWSFAASAWAQTSSQESIAAAQVLYNSAVDLMEKKNFAQACPKLQEAARLVPEGVGVRLQLGECYEGQGKLASAWTAYELANQLALRGGQADRAALAAQRAAKLKPQLATLTIRVPATVRRLRGLSIQRGGIEIGEPQWETPLPVDKAEHEVRASAEGKKPWHARLVVSKNGESKTITIGPLVDAPQVEQATSPPSDPKLPAGLVVGGVGVVGLGLAGAFGGMALDRVNDVELGRMCSTRLVCTKQGAELRSEARTFANLSTGFFVGGGVTLGIGTLLVILHSLTEGTEVKESRRADIYLGVDQLGIQGRW